MLLLLLVLRSWIEVSIFFTPAGPWQAEGRQALSPVALPEPLQGQCDWQYTGAHTGCREAGSVATQYYKVPSRLQGIHLYYRY